MFKKRTPTQAQREAFGRMIRDARKRLDLTQEKLAEAAGCSPHWINNIECGKSNPNWADAFLLAEMLGLTLSQILEEVGIDVPVLAGRK